MVLGALHLKEHHIKNITIKNRNLLLRENEGCTYGDDVTPVKKNLFMVTAYTTIRALIISFLEAGI